MYKARYHLGNTSWGAQFPQVTVYAVISESLLNVALTSSDRVLRDLAHHQWVRGLLLPTLRPRVQVPLYLGPRSTLGHGHWGIVLPQSDHTRLCGNVHPRSLFMRAILPAS